MALSSVVVPETSVMSTDSTFPHCKALILGAAPVASRLESPRVRSDTRNGVLVVCPLWGCRGNAHAPLEASAHRARENLSTLGLRNHGCVARTCHFPAAAHGRAPLARAFARIQIRRVTKNHGGSKRRRAMCIPPPLRPSPLPRSRRRRRARGVAREALDAKLVHEGYVVLNDFEAP